MRRFVSCLVPLLLLCGACFAQQTDVRQFATYSAFTYLATPSLNLNQRGFDGDFGVNLRPWLTFGFDFSTMGGSSALFPHQLSTAVQQQLAPLAPILGPNFNVPYDARTYTYEAGPQLNYRGLKKVTLFVRPALGALHSNFTSTSTNPVVQTVVKSLTGGSLKTSDTVVFYGFGGGATWEITPSFGIRAAVDYARYNFFSDVLNGPRSSVRLSIGTKFGFGKNIVTKK